MAPPGEGHNRLTTRSAQALLAQHHAQVAGGGNLLQHLQLAETHQGRAGIQQLGRVGLAAHGGCLLAADNQVGFGGLLGFRHLVQQILHLTGQDHIADTHGRDLGAQLSRLLTEQGFRLARQRILVGQQRVQVANANNRPQDQLRLPVQSLRHALNRADSLSRVRDTVRHHRVQAKRDLVRRHDLLTTDINHRFTQVHRDHTYVGHALPEGVLAGRQDLNECTIEEQHARASAVYRADFQQPASGARNHLQLVVTELHHLCINHLDPYVLEVSPERELARRQDRVEPTIDPDQSTLVVLQIDHDRAALKRTAGDHYIQLVVHQRRLAERNHLYTLLPQRVEDPVPASRQQSAEFALAEQQADFVALDMVVVKQDHESTWGLEDGD